MIHPLLKMNQIQLETSLLRVKKLILNHMVVQVKKFRHHR